MEEDKEKKLFVLLDDEELNSLSDELYEEIIKIPLYDAKKRKEIIKKHLANVQKSIVSNIQELDDSLISNIRNLISIDKL